MNTVHSIFGDQPADVLRGAVDEVLDVIKNQNKTGAPGADAGSGISVSAANSAMHPAWAALFPYSAWFGAVRIVDAAPVGLRSRQPLCADCALSSRPAACCAQTLSARRSVRSCWAR
jgi:hypothetical protein